MVGTTLVEIREHVEALADDEGEFALVCGRTGERPVPVAGRRFESRAVARNAARAAEQYRTALRRYDPQLPFYDLVVCQRVGAPGRPRTDAANGKRTPFDAAGSAPREAAAGDAVRSRRVEFCHGVAAAVFETLSDAGYGAVETAVMDAYFELAECVPDPDDLCLCLLESMATELDGRLSPAEQADVLARAADRLAPDVPTDRAGAAAPAPAEGDETRDGTDASVTATLARLRELGLVGDYSRPSAPPASAASTDGARTVVADVSGYALSARDGRLPVLPVVLELSRRRPDRPPSALRVTETDEGWRVAFAFSATDEPAGLTCARIRPAGESR
ncbi:DUF7551 domain-containing protein [Halogeometricum luteum]|uniref:Uncharacterized protein n=1 Tax=Halogeometricum luteum TaxID=2950537 RepID=A0ABU2G649_9EURY|nr:hypothetical protein [Halogeometricum sp. S3BR5-2]MDS0296255.1 hypothetical protein [Halogeometricum sp. S3BR5-2]